MKAPKRISYSDDVDILMIQLSDHKIDDAYETDRMIVHVDENKEPVLLEIFNGKEYLKELGRSLSRSIQREVGKLSDIAVPHQIRK